MRLDLSTLGPELMTGIRERIYALLVHSRFAHPSRWRDACVLFHPGRREVVHRQALAAEFQSEGLVDAAHEVIARRIAPGEILVHIIRDDDAIAGVQFLVVPLRSSRGRR